MTDVFLLYKGAWSDRQLRGVFADLEAAKAHADEIAASWADQLPHVHEWSTADDVIYRFNSEDFLEPVWGCSAPQLWPIVQGPSKFPVEYVEPTRRPGYQERRLCDLQIEQRAVR